MKQPVTIKVVEGCAFHLAFCLGCRCRVWAWHTTWGEWDAMAADPEGPLRLVRAPAVARRCLCGREAVRERDKFVLVN